MDSQIRLVSLDTASDPLMPQFKQLVRDFLTELGVSLDFQAVDEELNELPGKFSRSNNGCMIILIDDSHQPAVPVGCAALRDLCSGVGEVKRMFVSQNYRGRGFARKLLNSIISESRKFSPPYQKLRLDTLVRLKAANELYKSAGFYPIEAYCFNPIPDALYFEYDLTNKSDTK